MFTGSFSTSRPGKVVFTWDNSYSFFTSKTLEYITYLYLPPIPTEVLMPEDAKSDGIISDIAASTESS